MDEYIKAAVERIVKWVDQHAPVEVAAHAELKEIAMIARKQMAREILDEIKYSGSGGDDDYDDLMMVMTRLREVEENG